MTFWAASAIVSAEMIGSPESFRIFLPMSSFVPFIRTTSGTFSDTAFDAAARAHHSGGFTRDAIYLRGLLGLMAYLRGGGALEPLYAGKLSLRHLDAVVELQERGILRPPVLLPRFLESES